MITRFFVPVLDKILPPTCPGCAAPLQKDHSVCPKCWGRLEFISAPYCQVCAEPLGVSGPEDHDYTCGRCVQHPPHFSNTYALYKYTGLGRDMVLKLKHGNRVDLAPMLAKLSSTHHQLSIQKMDVIVPVPLHWTRLFKRGYNQAALLCRYLTKFTGVAWDPTLLVRSRRTPSQGTKDQKHRALNVASAFKVPGKKKPYIKGKTILLVDDVVASGATVNECAKALLTAGAKDVKVLVIAKSTLQT